MFWNGIEVLTLVRFTLLPQLASSLDRGFASVFLQIIIRHDFTTDEFVFKVGAGVEGDMSMMYTQQCEMPRTG